MYFVVLLKEVAHTFDLPTIGRGIVIVVPMF
jgi:hypothetical protein